MDAQISLFGAPLGHRRPRAMPGTSPMDGWWLPAGACRAGSDDADHEGLQAREDDGCDACPDGYGNRGSQAETVHRLWRSTSRLAVNWFLRSTARSARRPIVKAK